MPVEVRAPLGGGILNVLVAPGATVEAGDELIVIEAMKMQNLIYSPAAGTVTDVRVKAGDTVEGEAVLIVIA
jgi:biotin carboxyl carrier protein